MRLSTLAALMILTTIMLSACSQQQVAQVVDNSGNFFGRDAYPQYSSWNPAPANPQIDYKYKGSDDYGVGAEIASVTSTDLPPPADVASKAPAKPVTMPTMSSMVPAHQTPMISASQSTIEMAKMSEWQWPAQGQVTSAYDTNANGALGEGISIAAKDGTPIRAAGEGTVAYVGNHLSDFGNIVILRHTDGMMTSYAHAREILVSNGDHVQQGDLLGYVGKTGNVTAPQLHFSMRVADASVDPLRYLPTSVASR